MTNKKRLLVSHPGATVGSFVVSEYLSISDSFKLIETLLKYAKENKFDGIRLTLPPIFYQNRASNYIDYSLLKHGFEYVKREVTSTLFIESDKSSILKKFRPSHARAVRKAEDIGVEIKITNQVDKFYNILKENFKMDNGNYNKINSYWRSYSIIDEIRTLKDSEEYNFENNIKKIYQIYCKLSELYQENKDKNLIPLNQYGVQCR